MDLETNVNECMSWFRESLIRLVPGMDSARISWRDAEELPDDFDSLSSALFDAFVIENIKNSTQWVRCSDLTLRSYASQPGQDRMGSIQVRHNGAPIGALLLLKSDSKPFDTVVALDAKENKFEVPFAECGFSVFGVAGEITELCVEL